MPALTPPPASGQAEAPTPDDPAAKQLLDKAAAAMATLTSVREETTAQSRDMTNNKPMLTYQITMEYAAPDKSRYAADITGTDGKKTRVEFIDIGKDQYTHNPGETQFQRFPAQQAFAWPAELYAFKGAKGITDQGSDTVNGRKAHVILFTWTGAARPGAMPLPYRVRLWVDDETSTFLKREMVGQQVVRPGDKDLTVLYGETTIYSDFNTPITIEPPKDLKQTPTPMPTSGPAPTPAKAPEQQGGTPAPQSTPGQAYP